MLTVSTLLKAGATTVGVGAALISGAAVASAHPSSDTSQATHHTDSSKSAAGSSAATSNKSSATTSHKSHQHDAAAPASGLPAHIQQVAAAATPQPNTSPDSAKRHEQKPSPAIASTTPTSAAAAAVSTTPTAAAATAQTPAAATSAGAVASSASNSPGVSALLSVFAAMGQALSVAARDTESTFKTAIQNTSETLSKDLNTVSADVESLVNKATGAAASASSSSTSGELQLGDGATVGSSVSTALSEISQAQGTLSADTWGKGNILAGIASLAPETWLAVAKWALSEWQATNPGMLSLYANTENTLVGWATKLLLNADEMLPSIAQDMMGTFETITPAMGLVGASSAAAAANAIVSQATQDGRVYGYVPLTMYEGTEPIIEISVDGGPEEKVLVDTGSSGLVIPEEYVGTGTVDLTGLTTGTSAYSGGLTYTYSELGGTTVNLGSGVVASNATVDVVQAGSSTSAFESFISADGVVGVLGIGSNAVGPGPSIITSDLPGELKDGVEIDEADGTLVFGPNTLPVRASTSGSPNTSATVTVSGGSPSATNTTNTSDLLLDSGGVYGTIPLSDLSSGQYTDTAGTYTIDNGIKITVDNSSGEVLYSYTTNSTNAPTIDTTEGDPTNSGAVPFKNNVMYISYSTANGTTDFDY
ncbi:PecA family PE domain-processing aspartic protease [Mycobacterium sp. MAA66]|uniref:PecA family PE domain-processing aspartic protease n=1 Tax=Mycobacterium sp. MAA66 TaxID=3156297 RepID=UPI0035144BDA